MSEIQSQTQHHNSEEQLRIYMIVAYIFFFFFPLISAILAYIKRSEAKETIYFNHAQFILRTFWGGILAFLISFVILPALGLASYSGSVGLAAMVIGLFTLFSFVVWLWYLVRVIFGLVKAISRQTVKEKTWLI